MRRGAIAYDALEAKIDPPEPKTYTVRVCVECDEEIQILNAGDEWWDYCEGCHQIEPKTREIEYDKNGEEVA